MAFELPGRVGIVGLGHIGASLALRLARRVELAVHDTDPGAVVWVCEHAPGAVSGWEGVVAAEVVLVASPTPTVPAVLGALASSGATGLVLDVASVKGALVGQRPAGLRHLSVHPMAGREGAGAASADPAILDGSTWAFVLDGSEMDADVATALTLVLDLLGAAAVVGVSWESHDAVLAAVSHLPHALAEAMGLLLASAEVAPVGWWLASGSLRDATRVARSDPHRVAEMLVPNRDELARVLGRYREVLGLLEAALEAPSELVALLSRAHDAAEAIVAPSEPLSWEALPVDGLARALLDHGARAEAVVRLELPKRWAIATRRSLG